MHLYVVELQYGEVSVVEPGYMRGYPRFGLQRRPVRFTIQRRLEVSGDEAFAIYMRGHWIEHTSHMFYLWHGDKLEGVGPADVLYLGL